MRGAPKFPNAQLYELLWRAGLRSGDTRYFDAVAHTLERICEGGIYDHLGGGFSRYSVDEKWLVPHFEKMLYDNAQLLELLPLACSAHRQRAVPRAGARDGDLARAGDDDLGGRVLRLARRRLAKARRASSTSGRCLRSRRRWARTDAAFFAEHYDVTEGGNFEGHTILNRLQRQERSAADEARLAGLRAKLLGVRSARVRPGLDDKILADWNGEMIAALVHAGTAFGEPSWLDRARRAFEFIASDMTKGDRLGHSWRAGRLLYPGLASDFANMIRAALALYEATGQARLPRSRARLAARLRPALRQSGERRIFPHRRRRRRPGGAPELDQRRRDAKPERHRRAEPDPARRADRRPRLAREGRPAVRRRAGSRAGQSVLARVAAQRARPAAQRGGDRGDRTGPSALRGGCAEAAAPQPHRAARAGRRCAAGVASGAGQDRGRRRQRGVRLRRRALLAAGH